MFVYCFSAPIEKLETTSVQYNAISLEWSVKENSHWDKFMVYIKPLGSTNNITPIEASNTEVILTNLGPGTTYEVEVKLIYDDCESPGMTINVTTSKYHIYRELILSLSFTAI